MTEIDIRKAVRLDDFSTVLEECKVASWDLIWFASYNGNLEMLQFLFSKCPPFIDDYLDESKTTIVNYQKATFRFKNIPTMNLVHNELNKRFKDPILFSAETILNFIEQDDVQAIKQVIAKDKQNLIKFYNNNYIPTAIYKNNVDILKLILSYSKPNFKPKHYIEDCLRFDSEKCLSHIFSLDPTLINTPEKQKQQLLKAMRSGSKQCVIFIRDNFKLEYKEEYLDYAIKMKYKDIVRLVVMWELSRETEK